MMQNDSAVDTVIQVVESYHFPAQSNEDFLQQSEQGELMVLALIRGICCVYVGVQFSMQTHFQLVLFHMTEFNPNLGRILIDVGNACWTHNLFFSRYRHYFNYCISVG